MGEKVFLRFIILIGFNSLVKTLFGLPLFNGDQCSVFSTCILHVEVNIRLVSLNPFLSTKHLFCLSPSFPLHRLFRLSFSFEFVLMIFDITENLCIRPKHDYSPNKKKTAILPLPTAPLLNEKKNRTLFSLFDCRKIGTQHF